MDIIHSVLSKLKAIQLDESTGGMSRRWNEVKAGQDIPFVDGSTKEEWHMIGVTFLPADPSIKFEDDAKTLGRDKLGMAIQRVVEKVKPLPTKVQVFGLNHSKAAMVVIMQNTDGETAVFAKKVPSKRSLGPNAVFWQTSEFGKNTGLYAQTNASKKAALPIEPSDLIVPGTKYTIEQLIDTVTKGIIKSNMPIELKQGLPQLLKNLRTGIQEPIPGLADFQAAIETKLSELAVPIALKTGNFVVGNYEQVNEQLLVPLGKNWAAASAVSFPLRSEKLIDATLWFGDEKIDISVKDSSGGARPSTASIMEILNKGKFSSSFKSKYKREITILQKLDQLGSVDGPLEIAKMLGALEDKDIAFLKSIYKKNIKAMPRIPGNWRNLLNTVAYDPDPTHQEYQLGFHLLAIAARYVANELNKDSKKITTFFKTVLNQSNLIQVYAKTKIDKLGGLYYNQFKVVWPPVFEGEIEFSALSGYTARSTPFNKLGFAFVSHKGESGEQLTTKKKSEPTPDIRPNDAKVARKKKGFEKTVKSLGRARR